MINLKFTAQPFEDLMTGAKLSLISFLFKSCIIAIFVMFHSFLLIADIADVLIARASFHLKAI